MVSTALVHAHEFLPGDQLNSFEMNLLEGSTLASLVEALAPDYLLDQQRDRLHWTLRSVVEVAERSGTGGPQFVYAHVMSPHPPFLFNANGDRVRNPDCYPARCRMRWPERHALGMTPAEFAEGMREQVAYLNEVLIGVLDRLIQAQPDAVIILVSDHGARHDPAKQDEYFLNFSPPARPGGNRCSPMTSRRSRSFQRCSARTSALRSLPWHTRPGSPTLPCPSP